MPFTKQGEFVKKPSDLPDVPSPSLTPTEIKSYFDNPPNELKTIINKLIDDLAAQTAAGELGALDGTTPTNVQERLTKFKTDIASLGTNKTDKTGNHEGTWQGFTPSQVDETVGSRLDQHDAQLAQKAPLAIAKNTTLKNNKSRHYLDPLNTVGSDFDEYAFSQPNESDGDWTVTNGEVKPTYTTSSKVGTFAFYKKDKMQDGKISVVIDGWAIVGTTSYFGIVLRGNDKNNYLCAVFSNQNQTVMLLNRVNGVTSTIGSVDVSTHISKSVEGEPLLLSSEFVGGNIKVFMNNVQVLSVAENVTLRKQPSNGLFGLIMICSNSVTLNQNVTFNSLVYEKYHFNKINFDFKQCLSAGDSVTYGSLATSTELSYIGLLRSYLQSKIDGFVLDNVAVAGTNTNSIKYQVIDNIKLKDYDIVTVMSGINDSRIDSKGLTLDVSVENTREILRICKENNVTPILLLPTAIHPNKISTTLDRTSWIYLKRLVNKQKMLCAIENVICIETNEVLDISVDLDADQVHPNNSGHNKLFEKVKDTVFQ